MLGRRTLGITAGQIILGGIAGFLVSIVSLFLIEHLIWDGFLSSVLRGGFILYAVQLISFLAIYGSAVVCVGEVVRRLAWDRNISRRDVYQGAFLGTPAAAFLMSMATIDWASMDPRLFPNPFILQLVHIVVVVISAPVKLLLMFHIPPELLLIIGAPIGAILAYRLAEPQDEIEPPVA